MPGVPPETVAQVKTRLKTLFNRGRRSRSRQPPGQNEQQQAQSNVSTTGPAPDLKTTSAALDSEPAGPPIADEAAPIGTNLPVTKETPNSSAPPPGSNLTVPAPSAPKVDEHGMSATSGPLGDHLAGEEFGLGAHDDAEEEVGEAKVDKGIRSELEGGPIGSGKAEEAGEGKAVVQKEGEVAEMEGDKEVAREDGA